MSKQDVLVRKSPHNDKRYNKRYNKNKDYHHKHRKSKKKRIILICVLCLVGVLAVLIGYAASILINSDKYDSRTMFNPKENNIVAGAAGDRADANAGGPDIGENAVLYNGEVYQYNQDMVNVVFMGIDYEKHEGAEGETLGGGQADTILLIAINTNNNKMTLFNIPRDTMTEIKLYDLNRNYAGNTVAQIALSHAYGDGAELSNQLTVDAVSNLFYGLPIYRYITLDVAGIPAATDAVGGVTVTPPETVEVAGKTVEKGTPVTLDGKQAQSYVKQRDESELTSNLSRMDRQVSYLKGFFNAVKENTKNNVLFPVSLYQEIGSYASTDMSLSEIAYVARAALDSGLADENIMTVPGEMQQGEVYAEYIADDEELYQMILDTFYLKQPSAATAGTAE
ncbi:LCP family protein [Christensenella intestinihominis]|uniref:LCP family protein n=1 Tax=Christensenella intestinihominis TaxID=1851429 RepID=UPI00082A993E|nr:LCP family protein [Christensenella intestinihominis]